MMVHDVLPEFLQRSLGVTLGEPGSRAVWDAKCKDYFNIMSEDIGITWHSIHYPFSLSQDSAKIHHRATIAMLAPRLTPLEEYTTILQAAETQLGVKIGNVAEAFQIVIDKLKVARRGLKDKKYKKATAAIAAACRARDKAIKQSPIGLGEVFRPMLAPG